MRKTHLVIALVLLIGHCWYYYGWSIDDPYISYRYAENLAEGKGLVFNEDERVEGYSNFLLVLILAAAYKLGINIILFSRILGWVCAALALLVVYVEFTKRKGSNESSGFLGHISLYLLALNGSIALWSVGGLETALFALLVLLSVVFLLRHDRGEKRRGLYSILAGVFLLLAALTRPEGFVIFGAFVIYKILRTLCQKNRPVATDAIWLGIFIVGFLLYNVWRIHYYAQILPNTFYAKATGSIGQQLKTGIMYAIRFFALNGSILFLAMFIPLINAGEIKNRHLLFASVIDCYLFFIIYCGGDWMTLYRFFVPIAPLLYILVQDGLVLFCGKLHARRTVSHGRAVFVGITCVIMATGLLCEREETQRLVYSVKTSTWHQQYIQLGKWMRENLPEDSLFAGAEAGIIPYYSKLRYIDMIGLIDKHIARQPGLLHQKFDSDYIVRREPDFIVLNTNLEVEDGFPTQGVYPWGNDLLKNPKFRERYRIREKFYRGNDKYGRNYIVLFEQRDRADQQSPL